MEGHALRCLVFVMPAIKEPYGRLTVDQLEADRLLAVYPDIHPISKEVNFFFSCFADKVMKMHFNLSKPSGFFTCHKV